MKAVVVLALLVVSVSAMNMEKLRALSSRAKGEAEAEAEWDISEGISGSGALGKVDGHEQTVRRAWAALAPADKAVIPDPNPGTVRVAALHTPKPMIMGLQYPDMPIGGKRMQALGDDLTKPDHVTAGTFASLFAAGMTGLRGTFVAHTHFGCLQFWHAMAPEPYVGGTYKVWSNRALSDLIKASTKRIWLVAVAHMAGGRKDMAEFHVGRILHTIGDSYAPGHATRVGPCGPIAVFQEYNAQKGNSQHGNGDKPTNFPAQFTCAVNRIKEVLTSWAKCARGRGAHAQCLYPIAIDATFDIHKDVEASDAGGAIAFYAGPEVKKQPPKTVKAGGQSWQVYFPAVKGRRVAGTASVAAACPNF